MMLVELRGVVLLECYTKRCSQLQKLRSIEDRWRIYIELIK